MRLDNNPRLLFMHGRTDDRGCRSVEERHPRAPGVDVGATPETRSSAELSDVQGKRHGTRLTYFGACYCRPRMPCCEWRMDNSVSRNLRIAYWIVARNGRGILRWGLEYNRRPIDEFHIFIIHRVTMPGVTILWREG